MDHVARRHPRFVVAVAAELVIQGAPTSAETTNLSAGGAGLVLDRELEDGAVLDLTLVLTQDGIEDPHDEPFTVKATVMWSGERDEGGFSAGVRFAALAPEANAKLERFLAALTSNG